MDTVITFPDDYYEDNNPIMKSVASRTFVSWNGDTSVKSDFTKDDYDYFRTPNVNNKSRYAVLNTCQEAYDKIGIIKNVLDLMSDFGSKGISVRHTDPDLDKFCKKWFKKVNGPERTERMLNTLYRCGAFVVYEKLGRATNSITSKYIPIQYILLNPGAVQVKGEDKGIIPSDFEYVLRYSKNVIRNFTEDSVQSIIPEELKKYFNDGQKPLPSDRVSVYNYKKDDWQFWGLPIIFSLLDNLKVLEKLRLSDIAALDGAISTVRLWTVGRITDNPNTTIIPTKAMLQKVRNMIAQGVGGGSMDLVLGPEVSFTESKTDVHNFLGKEKYEPTLDAIYEGLGIASALRSGTKDGGSNGNISIKTLIERLNYGRMQVADFWTKQIKKVFEILGFKTEEDPIIEFDYTILEDEAAEKKLLLDMVDRDIVDLETVQNRFNINPDLSKINLKKEIKERGTTLPVKAGPFHNASTEDEMKKQLLQTNAVTPHEIGLKVKVDPEEQKKRMEKANKAKEKPKTLGPKKAGGVSGRPKNLTETKKRKPKTKSTAISVWASSAQKQISDIYTPIALEIYNKKNVRSLSVTETESLEEAKAKILFGMEPFEEINQETILKSIGKKIDIQPVKELWEELKAELGELTVDQKRQINSIFYGDNYEFNSSDI